MTTFTFPVRVSKDGTVSNEPSGRDPYALPWVQGAASTLPTRTRRLYPEQEADLAERLAVLKSKRPAHEDDPVYGPRRRGRDFAALDGRPLPEDGILVAE